MSFHHAHFHNLGSLSSDKHAVCHSSIVRDLFEIQSWNSTTASLGIYFLDCIHACFGLSTRPDQWFQFKIALSQLELHKNAGE
jgi:hypothetical protein